MCLCMHVCFVIAICKKVTDHPTCCYDNCVCCYDNSLCLLYDVQFDRHEAS